MSSLTFQYLRDLQQKERMGPELQEIDKDFYKRVAEYVARKTKLANNEFSDEREFQKMLPVIRDIFNRRETKIALAAIKAARSAETTMANLLPEEESLFIAIRHSLDKSRDMLESIVTGRDMPSFVEVPVPKKEVHEESKEEQEEQVVVSKISMKVLEDIPSFVAEDLNVYGPWKKDEVVSCPEKACEMFVGMGKAEKANH